ncbi:MAG: flagellar biosynthesis protein FlhF, partial [Lentisphaerae bacterium]|nr:flagellar biosynthesis protein FlhF [Lentisphaerota bacterium]
MKIRRYFGKDPQEAIQKIRAELGRDAIILNTRKVKKKGLAGLFSKPVVEVLAAIDEYDTGETNEREKTVPGSVKKISELENKINSMQDMLSKLFRHFGETTDKKPEEPRLKADTKNAVSYSQVLHRNLTCNDIDEYFARTIINELKKKMDEKRDVNECAVLLSNYICEILGSPETIRLRDDGKPTTVLFIGPTGVGKTTTLAKIAANYSLNYRKEVALVTTDTYRIAAVEQLKTYADI